jgi:hypothetical protein
MITVLPHEIGFCQKRLVFVVLLLMKIHILLKNMQIKDILFG